MQFAVCAVMSALWPVEWASAGLTTPPPFSLPAPTTAARVWQALAHPLYLVLQLSWIVAVAVRRRAGRSRAPLVGLLLSVAIAFVVLAVGLILAGSVTPGLIMVSLIPLVAGWSAVHGHVLARYRALSWLTDAHQDPVALPTALARTAAEALDAPGRTVWWAVRRRCMPWEREVLELMARGLSNAAICQELHLSVKT